MIRLAGRDGDPHRTSHRRLARRCERRLLASALAAAFALQAAPAGADNTPQALPFSQDWSNTGLITTNDDWSGVPGIVGYRGDDLTTATGTDPATILSDGSGTPVDVNANQTTPDTFATGGVAEFEISNPTVALNGSGTADAPHLVLHLNTSGKTGLTVSYSLRDIDGSTDNAVQQVALQYRIGSTGDFTNIPEGFVSDATTGPSLATQVTPVIVVLPAGADNQPLVQVRIITTNAVGNDEWVGVDNITVAAAGVLSVTIRSFTATAAKGGVLVRWGTAPLLDTLGFNLYRQVRGRRVRVNGKVIAAKKGSSYSFVDRKAPRAKPLRYWIQAVKLDGSRSWYGPARVR